MAYTNSTWLEMQWKLSELMQRPEFRHKPSSALMVFKQNTEFLVPNDQMASAVKQKNSDQQVVTIKVLNKQATTTASARAAAHTGSIGASQSVNASYTTYATKFKNSIKGGDRNVFSVDEMIAKQMLSAMIDLHGTIETALMADLDTNKSQVVQSLTPRGAAWDAINFVAQIAAADSSRVFQRMKGFMRQQFYEGKLFMICDEFLGQEFEYLANQGGGNATNLGFQLLNIQSAISEEFAVDAGYEGQCFMVTPGGVGLLEWIPKLNASGFGDVFAIGGRYDSIPDPLGSGLNFALHRRAVAADNQSASGETQDVDVEYEISVDLSPLHAPLSTSNADPVFKLGLLT